MPEAVLARAACATAAAADAAGRRAAVVGALAAAEPAIIAHAGGNAGLAQELAAEFARQINMARGAQQEGGILDAYGAGAGVAVVERNDRMYALTLPFCQLRCKIDGLVRSPVLHIVESKCRTCALVPKLNRGAPMQDRTQVLVYMAILRGNGEPVQHAVITEQFPCKEPPYTVQRETVVPWSDASWAALQQRLQEVCARADALTEDDVRELFKKCPKRGAR